MTSEQIFYPGLWYILLAVTAISLPLYVFLLWKTTRGAIVYLVFLIAFSIYMAFFSARNFGGAFGAGMAFACLSALLVPISLIVLLLLRRPFRRKYADDLIRRRLYVVGGVIIILVQIFPILGSYSIDKACYAATRGNASPLISAVQRYEQDIGQYPSEVQDLLPMYISQIPAPACLWLSGDTYREQTGFEITACRNGSVLLTTISLDGSSIERYNFATGNWSSISFLDGACSYLR
jgi:hypothetical protein